MADPHPIPTAREKRWETASSDEPFANASDDGQPSLARLVDVDSLPGDSVSGDSVSGDPNVDESQSPPLVVPPAGEFAGEFAGNDRDRIDAEQDANERRRQSRSNRSLESFVAFSDFWAGLYTAAFASLLWLSCSQC